MVIREVGIMIRGYPLVYSSYHQTGGRQIDVVLRSGLLSGILTFIEVAYKTETIEFIESKKYTIAFKASKIEGRNSTQPEAIVAYAILDKEQKVDKFISKNVAPFLLKVLKQFISKFTGRNLSEVTQFKSFRENLDKTFILESKSTEDKFKGLLS